MPSAFQVPFNFSSDACLLSQYIRIFQHRALSAGLKVVVLTIAPLGQTQRTLVVLGLFTWPELHETAVVSPMPLHTTPQKLA